MNTFDLKFTGVTLIAAVFAAIASVLTAALGWQVWAMFVGWVGFVTGQKTPTGAVRTYLCIALGVIIGNIAAIALSHIMPSLGIYALAPVVFVVAVFVLTLRAMPLVNVMPAYWLGIISFFAAHKPPSIDIFAELAFATALGVLTALSVHTAQTKLISTR